MTLNARLTVSLASELAASADLDAATAKLVRAFGFDFADGAGAGQASNIFAATRTLAAATADTLDLNGGTLVNALGAPFSLTKLKAVLICAAAANPNDLKVGNVSNGVAGFLGAASHELVLQPGGWVAMATPSAGGWPIVPATADLLRIANPAGGSSTYTLVLIGA